MRLLERIETHTSPSEPLCTETALARELGVNRMTVRQAVNELVQQGVLYRVRGVGVFVAPQRPVEEQLGELANYFDDWKGLGRSVSVEILRHELRVPPGDVREHLALLPSEAALFVERLRYVDGIPLALDYCYVVLPFGTQVKVEDLLQQPIHVILGQKLRLPFDGMAVTIEAAACTPEEARLLKVPAGWPLLVRRNVLFIAPSRRPVVYGVSYYRSLLYRWTVYVPRIRAANSLPESEGGSPR